MVATVEEGSLVTQDDPAWSDPVQFAEAVIRSCHLNGDEIRGCQDQLAEQLQIGEYSVKDKNVFVTIIAFIETDLVEHQ